MKTLLEENKIPKEVTRDLQLERGVYAPGSGILIAMQ